MKLLTSASDISKKIESVRKSGLSFQNGVQLAAVSIVAHLAKHRDKTLLIGLYDAMPNGSRRKIMIDWLNSHVCGFVASYTGKALTVELADVASSEWKAFVEKLNVTIETMAENPWHAFKPEIGEQDRSFVALVQLLTKKANSDKLDPETALRIGALVEQATAMLTDEERAKLAAK